MFTDIQRGGGELGSTWSLDVVNSGIFENFTFTRSDAVTKLFKMNFGVHKPTL